MNITIKSKNLFLDMARRSQGKGRVHGQEVPVSKAHLIEELKSAEMIRFVRINGGDFFEFLEAGKHFALNHGIEV